MTLAEKKEFTQELFEAVNKNEDFCKSLVSAENAASAQEVLKENGFDVAQEDVEAIYRDGVNEIMRYNESGAADELSEEQLDDVAGGGFIRGVLRSVVAVPTFALAGFGYGLLCGVCPMAAAVAPYVGAAVGTGLAVWATAGYIKEGW